MDRREIDSGYISIIKNLSEVKSYTGEHKLEFRVFAIFRLGISYFFLIVRLIFLYLYGTSIVVFLKTRLIFSKRNMKPFHIRATENISQLTAQYPMHMYPILAKAMELAIIREHLPGIKEKTKESIIELAIGDGTLSTKIFDESDKIYAFDINPYSLIHATRRKHIKNSIVADCLNPPVAKHGAGLIVCNNLLHHVTDKENAIKKWSEIASYALFNENTNYWATGWFKPYLYKKLGFYKRSEASASCIKELMLQDLWPVQQLSALVREYYNVFVEESFLSEKVFFLCSICSFILKCYGPPTPELAKTIMVRKLGALTQIITYHMAKALIEYDAIQNREKDTFVFWVVKSKQLANSDIPSRVTLVCPECGNELENYKCCFCRKTYLRKDEMVFLLPGKLLEEINYVSDNRFVLPKEHL